MFATVGQENCYNAYFSTDFAIKDKKKKRRKGHVRWLSPIKASFGNAQQRKCSI